MSTLKVNRIEPRTGDTVEIVGLDIPELPESPVKAWVNFGAFNDLEIRDSMNVSSITDNGTGDFTVNFATSMPDTKYAVIATTTAKFDRAASCGVDSLSTGSFVIKTGYSDDGGYITYYDWHDTGVAVMGA